MNDTIYVINPNSSASVTAAIDRAVEPLRLAGGPTIRCLTLAEGPPGVQTQEQVDGLGPPLCAQVRALEAQAGAFVLACFSDPGLHAIREVSARPVLGIAECGVLAALTRGQRFGVVSILSRSIPRHLRYFGAMGVIDRLAGDRAIDMGVIELADRDRALHRMTEVGRELVAQSQADVLVLGCAGMADLRQSLQDAVGVPVVEPTQAAVAMAIGRVRCD